MRSCYSIHRAPSLFAPHCPTRPCAQHMRDTSQVPLTTVPPSESSPRRGRRRGKPFPRKRISRRVPQLFTGPSSHEMHNTIIHRNNVLLTEDVYARATFIPGQMSHVAFGGGGVPATPGVAVKDRRRVSAIISFAGLSAVMNFYVDGGSAVDRSSDVARHRNVPLTFPIKNFRAVLSNNR